MTFFEIAFHNNMSNFLSYKISAFNFFLSVLIVGLHSDCKNTIGWECDGSQIAIVLETMSTFFTMMGHLAVPTFFVISGYLFYRNISKVLDIFVKIKKRLKTLLVPYLLWNMIFVLFFWIILHSSLANYMHMPNSLQTYQEIIIAIVDSKFTPLWFVKNLIIYVMLSPLLYLIAKKVYILFALIIVSIIYVYNNTAIDYFSFVYWLPIYLLGILMTKPFFKKYFESDEDHGNLYWVTYLVLFVILLYIGIKYNYLYLYRLLAPLFVWKLSSNILLKLHIKKKSYWKYSFFIYCTHFFMINIIQKLMFLVLGNSNFSYFCIYVSTPFIVLFICILTATFLEKYNNSLYNILTGNR